MIPPLFRRSPKPTIAALYGAVVAQARCARFYQDYGVADTVLGRFDMIVLHAAVLLRRMRAGDTAVQGLAQGKVRFPEPEPLKIAAELKA
jgi:cytochrome b pre-mRNA-processing protein 3